MIGQVRLSQLQNHSKRRRITVVTEKQTKMKEQHNRLFLCKSTHVLWNSPFNFQNKWKIRPEKQNQWMSVRWKPIESLACQLPRAAFFLGSRNSTMLHKKETQLLVLVTVKALFQCTFLILKGHESCHTYFSFCLVQSFPVLAAEIQKYTHHTWLFTWWYPGEAGIDVSSSLQS